MSRRVGKTRRVRVRRHSSTSRTQEGGYDGLVGGIGALVEEARRTAARRVNSILTATYWEIGRRIVEHEQQGAARAEYGQRLLKRLAADLTARHGRGYGAVNLSQMKRFHLLWASPQIFQTLSEKSGMTSDPGNPRPTPERDQLPSVQPGLPQLTARFTLPWSAYVRLLSVKSEQARQFYEAEAVRGGWSVRQLDRQIQSQFYERAVLSRNKVTILRSGARPTSEDAVAPEEELRDPYVLEFLNLKDEYSETDLEEALIQHLESFLLELGGDFCFAGRQKRLRIGDEWFRVDLLFYHRVLRCLVLIDLKLGRFTHADAGQMHVYLNYACEHWMHPDENPPVGLILCAQKDESLAHYALDNLPNKVLAAEYRTVLPDERVIATELEATRRILEGRKSE